LPQSHREDEEKKSTSIDLGSIAVSRIWALAGGLERIVIAGTGKWRDLRYGTGSVSDLSLDQKAF
jgi:hypothetical protein